MRLRNQIVLITYPDSMGSDLKDLHNILKTYFEGIVKGIHVLPFFPSSGDRGFSPMTYREVDPRFGTFEDIRALSRDYFFLCDYMINHISAQSVYYKDFLKNHNESPWKDLFIRYSDFWPGGAPTAEQCDIIYKRKPRAPYVEAKFADGSTEKTWCTFSEEQIDLDVTSETTKKFNRDNFSFLLRQGVSMVRLDAVAYATKKVGSNCFFVEPQIYDLLKECSGFLRAGGADILPEVHEHFHYQKKLADRGYWVYDFVLPMLVLHALYFGNPEHLAHWIKTCPRHQFTTLDTHDGIGVVDVKDILSDDEVRQTVSALYERGANVKRKYSSAAYNNLDIYQINCTYYSALGNNDAAYLMARAIQFFTPGIPQIYYVGLLAGKNDIALLEETKEGRNINRHYYTAEEIDKEVRRPVLQKLYKLIHFRNTYKAFDGDVSAEAMGNDLKATWKNGHLWTELRANLSDYHFSVSYRNEQNNKIEVLDLE